MVAQTLRAIFADLTRLRSDRIGTLFRRDTLFIFLSRNARRATNFFKIPVDRVVEIGILLEIQRRRFCGSTPPRRS
jgi:K+ transporter